jgi:acetyltransferase-like isoleucine patch superfamily enzyme
MKVWSGKTDLKGWAFFIIYVFRIKMRRLVSNFPIILNLKLKGVKVGTNTVMNGYPVIHRYPYSYISIGNNCTINSARNSIALNLNKKCTFATLRPESVISIGNNSGLTGTTIAAANKVIIGNNVLIGAYCTIVDTDFHDPDPSKRDTCSFTPKPVFIEDNVFLGMNCMILKGVTIGKNSVIGANSVVFNDIPANSLALGNPCKLIVKRNWEECSY